MRGKKSEKMIIGIDAHNLEGNRTGVGRYLFNLLKEWEIADLGSRIADANFILYFKDEIPADLPGSERFQKKLLNVKSNAKFTHWDLPRAAKKDKVDVLFCPAYVAPIFYKGKTALVLHDIIYEAHPGWFFWQSFADWILLKFVSKIAAKKAKIIFTPSEFSKQEIVKHYRIPSRRIIMTSAAADSGFLNFNTNQAVIDELKAKYRLKNKFGFFVGSLFERRHPEELIKAFAQLAGEKSDYQLLLAGKDHTKKKNIDDLIRDTNVALGREAIARFDFAEDNELKLLYRACAFFVYLSDYEGFGLPPLEAMSVGAPVIASRRASLKEVVGDAGLLIENNFDAQEIYSAMKKIAEDENLKNGLVKKGRAQAEKFSWKKTAEIALNALLEII